MAFFWILSFAIAWAITLPAALAQHGVIASSPVPWTFGALIGVAPIAAAGIAAALRREGRAYWRSLGRLPRPFWTAILAILLPALLLAITYRIRNAMGDPLPLSGGSELVGLGLMWLILAFGEEAGWRGFALPRLTERFGFWIGSLVLGLVWCVWHYPRLLGSPYLGTLSEALPQVALFSLQIVISNFIICWIYFRSRRSVFAATLFHTSFNIVATAYFLAATDPIMTGLMALVVVGIAIFDRHPAPPGQQ